jgi:carbonic anhydrase/acetyltransferase-like protein (isoleucine patch superfamily)
MFPLVGEMQVERLEILNSLSSPVRRVSITEKMMSEINFTPDRVAHRPELIDPTAWVAPTATVAGQVEIGSMGSIWFGAVLRGDIERIQIGSHSNIQDLCCLHSDEGYPCLVGNKVTVGHRAILHGAVIEDEVLVGMGAIILNGAKIGKHSLIGAGCLIPEGKIIPERSLVVGMPGRVIRQLTDAEVEKILDAAQHYVDASRAYALQC